MMKLIKTGARLGTNQIPYYKSEIYWIFLWIKDKAVFRTVSFSRESAFSYYA